MAIKVDPSTIIPTAQSQGSDWVNWHKALKAKFGKKQANTLFVKAWNKRKGSSASTVALRDYLKGQGINVEKSIFESTQDAGSSVLDTFSDVFKFGKVATMVAVSSGVLLTIFLIYNIAKDPSKTIGAVSKLKGR